MRFLARLFLNGLALLVAAYFVPGLSLASPAAALLAGAALGIVNAIVRPVLLVLTLPFTLLTLGLFIFVVNALCLGLAAAIVPGFAIASFTAAFFGALIVSIVSWILNGVFIADHERQEPPR
ncbi:MAG: phage holin family protein [Acidobacteria bacterium]|nr:phage holin family protein [Acidobacteriota bacterium]MBI3262124.1 phage holin family protein [Acidobacteriota bacterium]